VRCHRVPEWVLRFPEIVYLSILLNIFVLALLGIATRRLNNSNPSLSFDRIHAFKGVCNGHWTPPTCLAGRKSLSQYALENGRGLMRCLFPGSKMAALYLLSRCWRKCRTVWKFRFISLHTTGRKGLHVSMATNRAPMSVQRYFLFTKALWVSSQDERVRSTVTSVFRREYNKKPEENRAKELAASYFWPEFRTPCMNSPPQALDRAHP